MARIIAAVSSEGTAKGFFPPVMHGLTAWHFLNTSPAKAVHNYAPRKQGGAALIGSPVITENYAIFRGNADYLQTQVADAPVQTIFSVVRSTDTLVDDAHAPIFYGTEAAGSSGCSLYWRPASNQLWHTGAHFTTAEGPGQTGLPAFLNAANANIANWNIMVGVIRPTFNTLMNATTGAVHNVAPSAFPRSPSTQPFRIGSDYTVAGASGEAHVALWGHYAVELTDAEITANISVIRAYMAGRGIAV